jgi:hypothetical protein
MTHGLAISALAITVVSCGGSSPPGDGGATGVLSLRSTPFMLAAAPAEDYRCTWFAPDFPEGAAIKSFRHAAAPGVHHIALFWSEGESPQPERSCWSFGNHWVLVAGAGVGSGETTFPDGVALPLRRTGGSYVLQVHMLNTAPSPISVSAGFDLTLTKPGESYSRAGIYLTGNTRFQIPGLTPSYAVEQTCSTLPAGAQIVNLLPHMHRLGQRFQVERLTGGSIGGLTTLYDGAWKFDDQEMVPFSPAVSLNDGESLRIRCIWGNPGTQPVGFGESTTDEMCFGVFYYHPAQADEIDCVR